ncbi:MAG TPA: ATP-grasp domain-containing protein [Phycisphaerae bacterium]|nr:ATP-grasp domain-containing protein [Phycisphaerae bacterium]HUU21107.1 ATP-grasp domain-containing protein [Phycisphaerae bacterium]
MPAASGRRIARIGHDELNILFTCAGRRVALLEAFRRTMREMDLTGDLIAADMNAGSAALHVADAREVVPPAGTVHYIPSLLDICVRRRVGLLIPLTDLDLRSLSRHREKFAAVGCEVMIGSADTILLCRDKTRTCDFLQRIGLPSIRTLTLEQFRANPFFPCFVKPIRGSASIGTGVIHSEVELRAHVATFGDLMLVQDYVPGSEYTLDIFRTRAGRVLSVVPRQRLLIRSGEVEKGVTVHDSELIQAGVLLGEKLDDIWGVINAQCRRPAGSQARFFEVNPRFGGGAPLAIAAGANLPRYVLEERLGREVTARLGQFTPNLLMLRYDQAVFTEVPSPEELPGFDTPTIR